MSEGIITARDSSIEFGQVELGGLVYQRRENQLRLGKDLTFVAATETKLGLQCFLYVFIIFADKNLVEVFHVNSKFKAFKAEN